MSGLFPARLANIPGRPWYPSPDSQKKSNTWRQGTLNQLVNLESPAEGILWGCESDPSHWVIPGCAYMRHIFAGDRPWLASRQPHLLQFSTAPRTQNSQKQLLICVNHLVSICNCLLPKSRCRGPNTCQSVIVVAELMMPHRNTTELIETSIQALGNWVPPARVGSTLNTPDVDWSLNRQSSLRVPNLATA